ncbi:MAG: HDIG domain-containing metalloprotein [Bacteroidota bacterium]
MADGKTQKSLGTWLKGIKVSRDGLIGVSIGLVLVLSLTLLFPRGEVREFEYKVGSVWAQKDLIAPFSFSIFRDEEEYRRDVGDAVRHVFPVFERDTFVAGKQVFLLGEFMNRLSARAAYRTGSVEGINSGSPDTSGTPVGETPVESAFSETEWQLISGLHEGGDLEEVRYLLELLVGDILRVGILDQSKDTLSRSEVAIRLGRAEEIVMTSRLYDLHDARAALERWLHEHYGAEGHSARIAYKIGVLYVIPNLVYHQADTDQAVALAVDGVPRTLGFVQENERIVSKHERITLETKLKLDSYMRARADRGQITDAPSQIIGTFLHVALILTLFGIYLHLFRKGIVRSPRKLALIAMLVVMVSVVAYATREVDIDGPIEYLIVLPAASMLLTIFFDSRVGIYGTVTLAYLVAGIRGNDYSVALASFVAGALSVYTVRDMKNRTQIFRSLGFIFLGYGLTIAALSLERYQPLNVVGEQLAFALGNAIISPVLTYGLLIFLEKTFRLTTDLALVELAQFNHPLLRRLAEKAPGTYHHSMTMATLAEAAAAAIGANEILARVGAYYHDVGKTVKPTYFVENQKNTRSRHDKLSPRMSSLIITAHVKEGIALARRYNLPEEVIDFIPMHHGMTRIDFFYNKAMEVAKDSEDETRIDEIKEQDYRYAGPKPTTKETGIMMLADAIEAAVRSIEEPTPQRIEDLIDGFVKRRLEEGELDECPLTMSDLTRIKAAFLKVLIGVYHSRVKYPEAEIKRDRPLTKPPKAAAKNPKEEGPVNEMSKP